MLRELVTDIVKKYDRTMQPITYETHQIEWLNDLKKAKKAKVDGNAD